MSSVIAERSVEIKVGKLEADIEHIKSNTTAIATDVRRLGDRVDTIHDSLLGKIDRENGALRGSLDATRDSLHASLEKLSREIWSTKVWALLIAAAILGVMAHGFKWL
jgi:hypothetical protein